ncbi:MAG: hypothetical protein K6F69_09055 [Treponema sp.]|nr:hypothetical protein [Treponema sp.]
MNKIIFHFFIFTTISFTFFACTTLSLDKAKDENISYRESDYIPECFDWKKADEAIEYFIFENKDIPIRYIMAKIDLTAEQLKLCYYPAFDNEELSESREKQYYKDISVKKFSKGNECTIAINATQFL